MAAIVVPEVMGAMFSTLVSSVGFLTTCVEDAIIGTVTGAIADAGDQEIEISFGNQKTFNFRELDKALEMGALSGLASGLAGVSLVPSTVAHFTSAWQALEVDLKVSLLRTAFTEAADHGKVDWRAFVVDVIDAAASAEVGHLMPNTLEGGSEADAVADSVIDDLAKDALYHQQPDWENVAVDAVGSSIGTGIGKVMANKINAAIDDQRLRAQEAALRRTDMLSRANAIAANQEALASQLNSSSFSSSSLTREGRGGFTAPDFFTDENDDFASDWGASSPENWGGLAANDADLSGFTTDPFGTTTTTPTAQIHPENQGAQARARVSSTVAMQNALDKRISDNANHIFAQSASQQAASPHSTESTGAMMWGGIKDGYYDVNAKMNAFTDRHPDVASVCVGINHTVEIASLAAPVTDAVVGAVAIGSKALEGLSALASRVSFFNDTRLAAEGVSMRAADLGGEAASSARMNTSSNMYREMRVETKGAEGARLISSISRVPSDSINETFINPNVLKDGWLPPYPSGLSLRELTASQETQFARVFTDDDPIGRFLVRYKEIAHIIDDPEAIRIHLGLKDMPTHIADVYVPPSTRLLVGRIGAQPTFGLAAESGFQYQLLEQIPRSSFRNIRPLQQLIDDGYQNFNP